MLVFSYLDVEMFCSAFRCPSVGYLVVQDLVHWGELKLFNFYDLILVYYFQTRFQLNRYNFLIRRQLLNCSNVTPIPHRVCFISLVQRFFI